MAVELVSFKGLLGLLCGRRSGGEAPPWLEWATAPVPPIPALAGHPVERPSFGTAS
jgi:hypothetical protein